jgi:hypothetical protein
MTKQKPFVHQRDGFELEWFTRRSELEVNIYLVNPDGSRGKLVSELAYPKISGAGFSDWEPEAISIAKREMEKPKQEE